MNAALQGYAAAVLAELDKDTTATVAEDLTSLESAVLSNPDLRAALTDTSVSGADRREVVRALLTGKIAEPAVRLAAHAAFAVHAQDMPTSIAYLAIRARAAAEGKEYQEPPLGALAARQRVGGFATARFEELEVSDLEHIEDELFRFARAVESNKDLRAALIDRELPVAQRQGIIEAILAGKVSTPRHGLIAYVTSLFSNRNPEAPTIALLKYVVEGGRSRDVLGTIDWLVEQTAIARGWRVARVATAKPLTDQQADALRVSLKAVTGNPVELQVTENEALLGGVRIEVGDLLVDASAKGRLAQLRDVLDADHRAFAKTNEN
jgi:F-type H+-transporting ATPase subunit delta